jgi:hypothetical protein
MYINFNGHVIMKDAVILVSLIKLHNCNCLKFCDNVCIVIFWIMTPCNLVGGVTMVDLFVLCFIMLDIVHYLRNYVPLYIEPYPSSQYRSENNLISLVFKYMD